MSTAIRVRPSARSVSVFVVLALGATWAYDLVVGWRLGGWDLPLVGAVRDLGPVLAAVLVLGVTGGRGALADLARSVVAWRFPLRWYVVALVVVPACYLVPVLTAPGALAAVSAPAPGLLLLYPVLVVVAAVVGGPLLEEPGWRGFLLPALLARRWHPVAAGVAVGLVWAAWHATQYLDDGFAESNGGRGVTAVSCFVAAAVAVSVLMTWVAAGTRGSVLAAVLLHNAVNVTQAIASDVLPGFDPAPWREAVGFVAAALVVVVATRGRLGHARPLRPR